MTDWYTAESYWTKSSCLRNLPGSLLCRKLHGRDFKKPYHDTMSLADILRSNEKRWFAVSFVTLKIASPAVSFSISIPSCLKPHSCLWSQHRHTIHPGTLPTRPRETSFLSVPWICITRALAPELVPCVFLARRSHRDVPSGSWKWWSFTVSQPCRYLCPQMIRLFQCSFPAVWQTFECFWQICLDAY